MAVIFDNEENEVGAEPSLVPNVRGRDEVQVDPPLVTGGIELDEEDARYINNKSFSREIKALACREKAVWSDMFFWRQRDGITDYMATFGLPPALYSDVILEENQSAGALDPRVFIGRWCPICYILAHPVTNGVIQQMKDYYISLSNVNTRPAEMCAMAIDMWNKRMACQRLVTAQTARSYFAPQSSHAERIPLLSPSFAESHYFGGPCQIENAFFTQQSFRVNMLTRLSTHFLHGLRVENRRLFVNANSLREEQARCDIASKIMQLREQPCKRGRKI